MPNPIRDDDRRPTREDYHRRAISLDIRAQPVNRAMKVLQDRLPRCLRTAVCSANNTHITAVLRDILGSHKRHSSTGRVGFSGTKRGSPYAAEVLAVHIARTLLSKGVKACDVVLVGTGRGRGVIVKAINTTPLEILSISEGTKEPHNGCRPKKVRRV